ncbi:TetR/AcrR family transcriptional regulator [Sphingomonas immobilis]|uniref:TetR/AcrR family transcriptional regulator n=1 Tax=Sphingomonas immobilis TaxID=3063997 RepID=A0ABT9A370_9SPHN|nr:TetR/AcrR family transcriptional regulator [Sphingomonas sp. CA1-15]MDO7843784.1 TetR/AcrR family transcriptional regulator [Sphingomonas sp. CA1-15]
MPKGTGIKKTRAGETRAALVGAARRLFAQKGFHATGTPEIVAHAGVTRGALQHHFPRKEDLFLAVFDEVERDMTESAGSPQPTEPGAEWLRFKTNVAKFLDAASTPEVQRIILIDGPAVLGWTEWRRLEAFYGLGIIERAVIDGIGAGQIRDQPSRSLAHLILSIIDEAALLVANAEEPEKARQDASVALQTLLASLK